ncbi:integrase [Chromobacterium sp. ATCC 53434]|uniref:tyrosine-type recombinase/integrase n=1 Tax=Chromobacterium sp. (strain ATCC 53434 / SC 14030) TaxID=2059672 RepID=UPI000C760ED6|nr:tyrosine-type recombinase/integrase [Chromobacterium sp. ATCC 53434]AUH53599.1 integrase [Chromobacterium sp. ATCC 53434]
MRRKKSGWDLPPRMLRRQRKLKNGKVWVGYYYNGRDADGQRKEFPLGSVLNEAKRKWAEFECKPAAVETGRMGFIFDRYEKEVIPGKAPKTQRENFLCLRQLRPVFDTAPVDAITPQHVAQYRDKRTARVRANREIALLSHVFNMAREWGYTSRENPVRGVRKNKETPRDFYASADVWDAVYAQACEELQDAMDLSYLTGQRPGDVLKMRETDVRDGALEVKQNKTRARLSIQLYRADGSRTELGLLLDRIRARPRKVRSLFLIATPAGQPLNQWTLRSRFDTARAAAAEKAEEGKTPEGLALAERVRAFQFRDIRPKAASEIEDLESASALLGHTDKEITKKVYLRVGQKVKPTR